MGVEARADPAALKSVFIPIVRTHILTPPPFAQTLDALPAHLLTPFNGPVPPSNLLDKIARGVSHAKGPDDWPHSIRATRAKLVEISRVRAKEAAQDDRSKTITEEDDDAYFGGDVLQQTTNIDSRRPLYRQSSMDFMNTAKPDLKDNDNINRYASLCKMYRPMFLTWWIYPAFQIVSNGQIDLFQIHHIIPIHALRFTDPLLPVHGPIRFHLHFASVPLPPALQPSILPFHPFLLASPAAPHLRSPILQIPISSRPSPPWPKTPVSNE